MDGQAWLAIKSIGARLAKPIFMLDCYFRRRTRADDSFFVVALQLTPPRFAWLERLCFPSGTVKCLFHCYLSDDEFAAGR